jgi:drug/metabolite transporter (DMT)-like permease
MGSYDPLAANQIRVLAGIGGYVAIFSSLGIWDRARAALEDRRAMLLACLGGIFGPLLGVSLSLVAVRYTHTGVAASIMSTTPILILPAVVLLRREKVGARGVLGAFLAVGGLVLLFR